MDSIDGPWKLHHVKIMSLWRGHYSLQRGCANPAPQSVVLSTMPSNWLKCECEAVLMLSLTYTPSLTPLPKSLSCSLPTRGWPFATLSKSCVSLLAEACACKKSPLGRLLLRSLLAGLALWAHPCARSWAHLKLALWLAPILSMLILRPFMLISQDSFVLF